MDRNVIRSEISRLVRAGSILYGAELIAHAPDADREKLARALPKINDNLKAVSPENPANKDIEASLKELLREPDFASEYQTWYSPALRVVEQLLPDRYDEFRALYRLERRKEIDIETYSISDYLSGIRITRLGQPAFDAVSVGLGKFNQQISIVRTAEGRLDSVLTDIGQTLHAEILDNELGAARSLLKASHIRSAGVIAGVVLEGHLKKLIADHAVTFRKTATLSNLNDALKGAGVYDPPQWRQIQYLADIRNLCGHKSDRDPEREEVESLIDGVAKITKTLF